MKSICLLSSFRFYDELLSFVNELKKEGIKCEFPIPSKFRDPENPTIFLNKPTPEQEKLVENKILEKIKNSEIVFIFNPNGYVGNAVIAEIGYAKGINKLIFAMEPIEDVGVANFLDGIKSKNELIEFLKQSGSAGN